jgi:hypothetical protein
MSEQADALGKNAVVIERAVLFASREIDVAGHRGHRGYGYGFRARRFAPLRNDERWIAMVSRSARTKIQRAAGLER